MVCGETWGQRALWIIVPVRVRSNVDIDLSGVILIEVSCGDLAKGPIKYILDEEDLVDEGFFLQVDGHGEGVSRCYLVSQDFEA